MQSCKFVLPSKFCYSYRIYIHWVAQHFLDWFDDGTSLACLVWNWTSWGFLVLQHRRRHNLDSWNCASISIYSCKWWFCWISDCRYECTTYSSSRWKTPYYYCFSLMIYIWISIVNFSKISLWINWVPTSIKDIKLWTCSHRSTYPFLTSYISTLHFKNFLT